MNSRTYVDKKKRMYVYKGANFQDLIQRVKLDEKKVRRNLKIIVSSSVITFVLLVLFVTNLKIYIILYFKRLKKNINKSFCF